MDFSEHSDADLLSLARSGQSEAFGCLWERHSKSLTLYVRKHFPSLDPEEVVSHAFIETLEALERGSGPDSNFRAYMYRSVTNQAFREIKHFSRFAPEDALGVLNDLPSGESLEKTVTSNMVLYRAFNSLPERWKETLWYLHVESMPPREVAPLLGLTPNNVSALGSRARRGLQAAWIQEHVSTASLDPACRAVLSEIGGHYADTTSDRTSERVRKHLRKCGSCAAAALEATSSATKLEAVLIPALAYFAAEESFAAAASIDATGEPSHVSAVEPAARTAAGSSPGMVALLVAVALTLTGLSVGALTMIPTNAPSPAETPLPTSQSQPTADTAKPPVTVPSAPEPTADKPAATRPSPHRPDALGKISTPAASPATPTMPSADLPASQSTATAPTQPPNTPSPVTPSPVASTPATLLPPTFGSYAWGPGYRVVRLAGAGAPNTRVRIWAKTTPEETGTIAPVDSTGTWSLELPVASDAPLALRGRTLGDAGATSGVFDFAVALQPPRIPAPTIRPNPAVPGGMAGVGEPNSQVLLMGPDGTQVAQAFTDSDGNWGHSLAGIDPVSVYEISAQTAAGPFRSPLSAPAPVLPTVRSKYTHQHQTVLEIQGIPLARITITSSVSGKELWSGSLSETGTATATLGRFAHTAVSIRYCNQEGQCSPYDHTKNQTAPPAPSIG